MSSTTVTCEIISTNVFTFLYFNFFNLNKYWCKQKKSMINLLDTVVCIIIMFYTKKQILVNYVLFCLYLKISKMGIAICFTYLVYLDVLFSNRTDKKYHATFRPILADGLVPKVRKDCNVDESYWKWGKYFKSRSRLGILLSNVACKWYSEFWSCG